MLLFNGSHPLAVAFENHNHAMLTALLNAGFDMTVVDPFDSCTPFVMMLLGRIRWTGGTYQAIDTLIVVLGGITTVKAFQHRGTVLNTLQEFMDRFSWVSEHYKLQVAVTNTYARLKRWSTLRNAWMSSVLGVAVTHKEPTGAGAGAGAGSGSST
jgi:hypothetical protein